MCDPESYGDVTGEYLALREAAGIAAGEHDLLWVEGPEAVAFLDGQLSQDVAAIPDGGVARSFLLEPRGKLRGLLRLLRGSDRVGILCGGGRGPAVTEALERFRFRVEAALRPDPRPVLTVRGPGAGAVLAASGLPVPTGWAEADGVLVARVPQGGLPGFAVVGIETDGLEASGARRVGTLAAEAVRIEAGEPRFGVDLDESALAHETGLVGESVSFTKGCYLGQELVSRIETRGHANRILRGVVLGENLIPPPGAEVETAAGVVGTITSVGESLALRAPVALGLIRTEVEPGRAVRVRWEGGAAPAVVHELPLDEFVPS